MSKKSKMKVEDILPVVVEPVIMMETPKKTRKKKEMKETEVQLIVPESELNKNYETDIDFANKLLSLDFKPVKKSKSKVVKVKSPVHEELELNRNYEEPVKESKPKAGNAWIAHIKAFALQNGITYNKAMLDPRLKETYIKSTKGKVTL
jgi:hypothetical protein